MNMIKGVMILNSKIKKKKEKMKIKHQILNMKTKNYYVKMKIRMNRIGKNIQRKF